MTEAEWLGCGDIFQSLIYSREVASVRKLRLICAELSHWLQSFPEYADAKPCADLIEHVADRPLTIKELEQSLYARPGNWALAKTLGPDNQVGKELNQLVWFAENDLRATLGNPNEVRLYTQSLLLEVIGNPFHPITLNTSWLTSTVLALANSIYSEKAFDRMPILADALQDAGCDNEDILKHCREQKEHVKGCWVVDLLTGRS